MTTTGHRPVPSAFPSLDPGLLAQAVRDMRLTWRARGVLAELALGYTPGQQPTIRELTSLNRSERRAAEGREAFGKAVAELRALGYLKPDGTSKTGVGERLVIDLVPAADAHLLADPNSQNPIP
ncbi:hypothetical protein [Streptomyces sp. bgisy082]|uniref:hypothetical protein n=1 Tax=Streptomyces sp. bgisy082 TaxID=3413776 RepID=UPI003D730A8E